MEEKRGPIYLAGKITGDDGYFTKFATAQRELEKRGFAVVNPAWLPPNAFTYEAYMRMSQAMLNECPMVCFLPDWAQSDGAKHEFRSAIKQRKYVFLYTDIINEGDAKKKIDRIIKSYFSKNTECLIGIDYETDPSKG